MNNTLDFYTAISEFIGNDKVLSMADFVQHGGTTCLDHSLLVSYMSYRICSFLKLDAKAAARGALLHDFFLYDWHEEGSHIGFRGGLRKMHGFSHPETALKNAEAIFSLSEKEKNIIVRHMWPLTITPPKYLESLIVCLADKICAVAEASGIYRYMKMRGVAQGALKEAEAVG